MFHDVSGVFHNHRNNCNLMVKILGSTEYQKSLTRIEVFFPLNGSKTLVYQGNPLGLQVGRDTTDHWDLQWKISEAFRETTRRDLRPQKAF